VVALIADGKSFVLCISLTVLEPQGCFIAYTHMRCCDGYVHVSQVLCLL
jgi:hypothetical protein